MRNKPLTFVAGAALVGVLAAGCGDSDNTAKSGDTTSSTAPATTMAPMAGAAMATDVSTGASTLRSTLTALLQEHVYLAGTATGAALGGRTEDFSAAADTLDKNTVSLSQAIGSVYGDEAAASFLPLWRAHIQMFVDYTQGKAGNDAAKQQKARADLDGYRADFGAFVEKATAGGLTKDAVASDLKMHVDSLITAIDAQAAKDPAAFTKLKAAADHMPMTANVLATAIVKQMPEKFSGATDTKAAELRAGLTALLQEHVYLAGSATGNALGGRTADFTGAATALDANSVELSQAIGSVYGPDAAASFLELWRAHIQMFVDYTQGKAANDTAKQQKAAADLDGYRADFGAFIEKATAGGISKDAVASDLQMHVSTLVAAVDAQAAKDIRAIDKLQAAAQHMPMTAEALAGAIAKQKLG